MMVEMPTMVVMPEEVSEPTVEVETTRFGPLRVAEAAIITFPEGLLGFENRRRFTLVPQADTVFAWLQSLDRPDLAFLLLPPAAAFPDYAPLDRVEPGATLWVIVTVPDGRPRDMTANLLGPLLIDAATRQGRQIVVEGDRFTTRHRLLASEAQAA